MSRLLRCAGAMVTACALAISATHAAGAAPLFKRGATLVEFFMFPPTVGDGAAKAYAKVPFRDAKAILQTFDLPALRTMGFDHLRIPVDVGPLMGGDEALRRDFLSELGIVISTLHANDFGVIVTLHPPSLNRELPETYLDGLDGAKFQRYFQVVEMIARELDGIHSGRLALEPMNEPQSDCRRKIGLDWTAYQEHMVERLRRVAPDLVLFLTGGCWSNIEGIVLLDTPLLRDAKNLVTVHFYYPFVFTHQAATWSMPYMAALSGIPYPAAAGDRQTALSLTRERARTIDVPPGVSRVATLRKAEWEIGKYFFQDQGRSHIEQWMKQVADWQARQRIPADRIVFTEFGAMKHKIDGVEIDKASRAQWINDTSAEIERHGWGWTIYVLRDDPFGLYARKGDRYPDPALLHALRLNAPVE